MILGRDALRHFENVLMIGPDAKQSVCPILSSVIDTLFSRSTLTAT
jgi:hypothetical protein